MQVLENCEGACRCGLLVELSGSSTRQEGALGLRVNFLAGEHSLQQHWLALKGLLPYSLTTCKGLSLVQSNIYSDNIRKHTSSAQIWFSVVPTIVVVSNDIKSSWLFK